MLCKLCKEIFNVELSYAFLFSFPEICPICSKKFEPCLNKEIIPITDGEITYLYLYEENSLNLEQRQYLDRNLKLIYKEICLLKEQVIVHLDFALLKEFDSWAKFILPMRRITLFSLTYLDLSKLRFFQ